jgi:predicted methyltransferase
MDPRVAANRALWDEWTPIHVRSDFYDVEGWTSGAKVDLYPLLVDEVGDVAGKDLLHLQCHFGLDTLAWARRGARVTGVDISERGIQEARRLAAETGLDATFVVSDVVELPATLEGCDFDVVFTSFGAPTGCPTSHAGPRWSATSCARAASCASATTTGRPRSRWCSRTRGPTPTRTRP